MTVNEDFRTSFRESFSKQLDDLTTKTIATRQATLVLFKRYLDIFHEAYKADKIRIPETLNRPTDIGEIK